MSAAEFIDFARVNGVVIDKLVDDDKLHRVPTTEHPRSRSGAYRWDGTSGFVWNWEAEGICQVFRDPHAKPRSLADQQRAARRRENFQQEREHNAERAAAKAQAMLASATVDTHGYLELKGLGDIKGLVLPDGELMIPMIGLHSRRIVGAQTIKWLADVRKWEKKYLFGMNAKGAVARLGPARPPELFLCEGWATGLSIEMALHRMRLNAGVLVTFSAANLQWCAQHTVGRRIVIADHDAPQRDPEKAKHNPGCTGQLAAASTGLPWVCPNEEGWDANDVHKSRSLTHLCAMLMTARAAEPAPFVVPPL
jgi:putative DNA primase/helicase